MSDMDSAAQEKVREKTREMLRGMDIERQIKVNEYHSHLLELDMRRLYMMMIHAGFEPPQIDEAFGIARVIVASEGT